MRVPDPPGAVLGFYENKRLQPESISLSDILALIVYSDVAYADRPPGRSITLVFLCANWRFSNPLSSGPRWRSL